eukprot:Skav233543  [mRNA]  locus=scaffold1523:228366:229449:- [translate_table: standard]
MEEEAKLLTVPDVECEAAPVEVGAPASPARPWLFSASVPRMVAMTLVPLVALASIHHLTRAHGTAVEEVDDVTKDWLSSAPGSVTTGGGVTMGHMALAAVGLAKFAMIRDGAPTMSNA